MIYTRQPISYTLMAVKLEEDSWFDVEVRFRNFPYEKDSCVVHTRKSNWPVGVTPIAVRASARIQRLGGQVRTASAVGLGLTKVKAHCDAQKRLREKLIKLAKMEKALITYGPDEVLICRRSNEGTNLFGRGANYTEAVANLNWNAAELERMLNRLESQGPVVIAIPDLPEEQPSWFKRMINRFR